ncbi:MAG: EpsG family protein [Lachnospiraceae bacterium]|nr:EpsG family protein [Lachnospiraceae bacterium]
MEISALLFVFLTLGSVGLALLIQRQSVPVWEKRGFERGGYVPPTRQTAVNAITQFAIYALLAGVSACRFAIGNDYWPYRENFKRIFTDGTVSSELGFNLTVKALFHVFGYDNYLPVFAFFSLLTVLFFVLALRDQSECFALSLFLLMTNGYYFQSFNTIRYYLALAVALYSMKYVLRKEFGKFVLLVLFFAMFHKTILFTIPAYLLAYYLARTGFKKWHVIVGGAFLASLVFGQKLYRWVIFQLYPYYENSHFDAAHVSIAGIAKCLGALALCVIVWWMHRKEEETQADKESKVVLRFYAILSILGIVTFLCGSFVPEVTRIGYYLIASQVFLIPTALGLMKKGWIREICKWGCILAFSCYFVLLLKQLYQNDVRILPYMSWIFYYK